MSEQQNIIWLLLTQGFFLVLVPAFCLAILGFIGYKMQTLVKDYMEGLALLKDGIQNAEFKFDGRVCTVDEVGWFKTIVQDIQSPYKTNKIRNSELSKKIIWIKIPQKNGHSK